MSEPQLHYNCNLQSNMGVGPLKILKNVKTISGSYSSSGQSKKVKKRNLNLAGLSLQRDRH
jgi:hypothetical protein